MAGRKNITLQLIIFSKCSKIHRSNCSMTSDDVHAEALTLYGNSHKTKEFC